MVMTNSDLSSPGVERIEAAEDHLFKCELKQGNLSILLHQLDDRRTKLVVLGGAHGTKRRQGDFSQRKEPSPGFVFQLIQQPGNRGNEVFPMFFFKTPGNHRLPRIAFCQQQSVTKRSEEHTSELQSR